MRLNEHLTQVLRNLLERHRVVVWYDGECAFGDFVAACKLPVTAVVANPSALHLRRRAEDILRGMNRSGSATEAQRNLLLYLPRARHNKVEARATDPFELFAAIGCAFGDKESEQLRSLAIQAMPEFADRIARMFQEGQPTLAALDRLEAGDHYPLVKQALGTSTVVEVATLLLSDQESPQRVDALAGCRGELMGLLNAELGYAPTNLDTEWPALQQELAQYVLLSELAFDLPQPMPAALNNLPRANVTAQPRIFAICERLRDGLHARDLYIDQATSIEQRLALPGYFQGISQLGERDTFPFEEKQYLNAVVEAVQQDNLAEARGIIEQRSASIWHVLPVRAQLWRLAERCVTMLEVTAKIEQDWVASATSLRAMIEAYTADRGWWQLDHAQRHMEQSAAQCSDGEVLEPLLTRSRARYRELAGAIQDRFLALVAQQGWAPEGINRQDALFDRVLSPALAAREPIALLLVDSLRYEMGCDLAKALGELGSVTLQNAAASIPTITPVGMAALLPGASGALALRTVNGQLTPHLGATTLPNLEARRQVLQQKYGDRYTDLELGEFLSMAKATRQARVRDRNLIVVRDLRIDNLGETATLHEVRKHMHDLLGDIKDAALQLTKLGIRRIVVATDHGYLLFPEIRPEDVFSPPDGVWILAKRRALLGAQLQARKGVTAINAASLGIQGDVEALATPRGYGVFSAGSGYLHGGLSLQECVVPLLELQSAAASNTSEWGSQVQITYHKDRFTSRALNLKALLIAMSPSESRRMRIEAYVGPETKATKVGEATECDARDDVTNEIVLHAGVEAAVPMLLDSEFSGDSIEIRATDSDGIVLYRLELKNGMLD